MLWYYKEKNWGWNVVFFVGKSVVGLKWVFFVLVVIVLKNFKI